MGDHQTYGFSYSILVGTALSLWPFSVAALSNLLYWFSGSMILYLNALSLIAASDIAISGHSSAYFQNKKCQEVLSMGTEDTYIDEFIKELGKNGITNNQKKDLNILLCGWWLGEKTTKQKDIVFLYSPKLNYLNVGLLIILIWIQCRI